MKWIRLLVLAILLLLWPTIAVASTYTDITITAQPTTVPYVETLDASGITSTTGILNGNVTDPGGFDAVTVGFYWGFSTGNYTESWNTTGTAGTFQHEIGGLALGTHVFYIAFVINDLGSDNGTEKDFYTLEIPLEPTNLVLTQTGVGSINITWTKGAGATNTIIVMKEEGCATNVTDGYVVYNDTGIATSISGLSLYLNSYCIRGWSWNDNGYSVNYAEESIGGSIMGLIGMLALCGIVSFLSFRSRFYLIKLLASAAWIAMFIYWMSNPPAGIDKGTPPHIAFMLVFIGLAIAIPIMGLGREIDVQKDWMSGLRTEKTGAWHFKLPDWMKGSDETETRKRQEGVEDYRRKIHDALHPRSKEQK